MQTLLALLLLLSVSPGLVAQGELAPSVPPLYPPPSTTQHSVEIAGRTLQYTATAATIPLTDQVGKTMAHVFFIAYEKDGVDDPRIRPLLFSFNGGPGAASTLMHMGLLGPRRALLDDDGFQLEPPYQLVNNEYSALDVADLVFIDPVSTGYSRAVPDVDPKQFHGFREDLESVSSPLSSDGQGFSRSRHQKRTPPPLVLRRAKNVVFAENELRGPAAFGEV